MLDELLEAPRARWPTRLVAASVRKGLAPSRHKTGRRFHLVDQICLVHHVPLAVGEHDFEQVRQDLAAHVQPRVSAGRVPLCSVPLCGALHHRDGMGVAVAHVDDDHGVWARVHGVWHELSGCALSTYTYEWSSI